jgi:hypothetical protein
MIIKMTEKPSSLTTPGDSEINFKKDTSTPPLSDEQLEHASEALQEKSFIEKFPRVDRNLADPPIHSQQIGLFSFIPAKGATPNEKGIFGFAKLRGNFQTENEASDRAEEIIRNTDSVHTIFHTYVGRPFPITLNEKYAAETSEVDIRREAVEAVSAAIKNKKAEDKRIADELKQREEELIADTKCEDPEKLEEEEYVTLRVKKAQLSWTYLEHIAKIKEIKGILLKTIDQINEIDKKAPKHKEQYFAKYVEARKNAGLNVDANELKSSFLKYLVEDAVLPGINQTETFVDDLLEKYVPPETVHASDISKKA